MRIIISTTLALAVALTAGRAFADEPDPRAELRAKIQARSLELRVDRVSKRLALDAGQRKGLEALLRKHDGAQQSVRDQRRALRQQMRAMADGDDKKAAELFDQLMAHKRKSLELELDRATALRQLLGANRGLRAVVILTRIERRIEARMRSAMKERRGRKRQR